VLSAEKPLMSDSNKNELLIINLATAPAEEILFPHLLQAVKCSGYLTACNWF